MNDVDTDLISEFCSELESLVTLNIFCGGLAIEVLCGSLGFSACLASSPKYGESTTPHH